MTEAVTPLSLAALSSALASVVEQVGPSVVRVDDGSRLTASGIVWTADGIILASSHGVERDDNLAVEAADGARLAATLVGRDPDTDLAVLRVNATALPAVVRAATGEVKIGHLVLALGRPGNTGLQASIGIISARLETERRGKIGYILHTDAVLYPGFSGGALVDANGRAVGMTNLMFGRGRGVAVGTPVLEQVAEAILTLGRVPRSYLGVRAAQSVPLPEALRQKLALAQEQGLLVAQVEAGSPAEQAGLILGDTLLGLDERPVTSVDALRDALRALAPGHVATLRVARGGELRELAVTLGPAG